VEVFSYTKYSTLPSYQCINLARCRRVHTGLKLDIHHCSDMTTTRCSIAYSVA